MAEIFLSPGVYTREQDFSAYASRVGLTKLGLVGLTLKGPAFEPIKISSTDEFNVRFGSTSTATQLPYVANSFLTQGNDLTIVRVLGNEGYTSSPAWIIRASTSDASLSGSPLCVIRSKKVSTYPNSNAFEFSNQNDLVLVPGSATSNSLANFTISGISSSLSANPITVSLDETQASYIVKIIGKNPIRQSSANEFGIYVEAVYPHFLRQYAALGTITGLTSSFAYANASPFTDYTGSFTNSITPWVVSNIIGNNVKRLFRFQTISDGDSSAQEVKISITNIDYANYIFDVIVRRFNDTDATAGATALEAFRGCSLDSTTVNYIGNLIGTTDEVYPRKSNYITVDLIDGHPVTVVPAGFEGYPLITANTGLTQTTGVLYKTGYTTVDSVSRAFLGISELAYFKLQAAYNSLFSQNVNIINSVKSIETDLFKFRGNSTTANTITSLGFHLENCSNISLSGSFISASATTITGYTRAQAKFTLVPFGGFDGFNPYKTPEFRDSASNNSSQTDFYNVIQLKQGIDVFANPEAVDINLFALPGINFTDSSNTVRYALEMVEDRADSLYIIDAPQSTDALEAQIVVNQLADTGLDSNYAATYWPWVQILDQNLNKFVYISPTAQVVQSIAFTDNISFPWFAPAGFNRGLMNVVRAQKRLNKGDRDTLYEQRVNPIATFTQQGVVIYGQKTLQQRQSALDRINVRRLLLQIRKVVAAASQTLLFEQNDVTLQDQFKSKVEPILLQIQNNRGLFAFKVIMDSTNNTPETIDRNTLVGKIQLKPTRTAEFISLDFQVLPTGANFSEF